MSYGSRQEIVSIRGLEEMGMHWAGMHCNSLKGLKCLKAQATPCRGLEAVGCCWMIALPVEEYQKHEDRSAGQKAARLGPSPSDACL